MPEESREQAQETEQLARELARWQNLALTLAEMVSRLREEVRELRRAVNEQAVPGARGTA